MRPVLSPYVWQPGQPNRLPTDVGVTQASPLPASMVPPAGSGTQAANAAPTPMAVNNPGNYGEAYTVPVIFGAAGALLALPRPSSGIRKLLIINNTIAGFAITIGFDTAPTVASGLQIATGGNLFFDIVVPQNDIWIFAPAAGTVQVIYQIDNISG